MDIFKAFEVCTFSLAMVNRNHYLRGFLVYLKEAQKPSLVPCLKQLLVEIQIETEKSHHAVVDLLGD